jgi:hypothetical protein
LSIKKHFKLIIITMAGKVIFSTQNTMYEVKSETDANLLLNRYAISVAVLAIMIRHPITSSIKINRLMTVSKLGVPYDFES